MTRNEVRSRPLSHGAARVFHPRSLTSFHSLHYVHAPFHSVPNEVRDERPSRVMRTGKERE